MIRHAIECQNRHTQFFCLRREATICYSLTLTNQIRLALPSRPDKVNREGN